MYDGIRFENCTTLIWQHLWSSAVLIARVKNKNNGVTKLLGASDGR